MQNKLQVLVVDDELPARQELIFLLEQKFSEYVEVIGEAEHGWATVERIKQLNPSVVFLDIQMPGLSGLEVAQIVLDTNPNITIIFITAYDNYALKAFELNAFDYLVKPFNLMRLEKTIFRLIEERKYIFNYQEKLEMLLKQLDNVTPKNTIKKIPCEESGKILLVKPEEIYYCTVEDGNVFLVTKEKRFRTFYTLNDLEKKLNFFRTHRSYLVNLDYIKILEPLFNGCYQLVLDNGNKTKIPVSRNQSKKLKEILEL